MDTTDRIRVAHITTTEYSLRYLLLNQLKSIQAAGYEVVGISASEIDVVSIAKAGIRHISVPITRNFTPLSDLVSLWRLYWLIRHNRFRIVHTHNPKTGLLGQLAAKAARVPVVINTVHGFYFHDNMQSLRRRFYILMEKIAARCSDVILSQNREDMEVAVREGICTADKIIYLGNGIDIERFYRPHIQVEVLSQKQKELGLVADKPVVGFVGRLVAEKGVLELLQAVHIVLTYIPDVQFLIVGPVDEAKPDHLTPSIAVTYGVEQACIFTGMRQDMPELYALMDLFVLPSHREGFPRCLMEASAMGIPCIATDIRGCREVVEHNKNGLLVSVKDPTSLAQAIIALLTNKERAQVMGKLGRQMAVERFDERLVFARVKTEYARLLRQKGLVTPELS
jgi:glycosyltransferase involved in cell wall biosynthesis